jgi:hypothetical protein
MRARGATGIVDPVPHAPSADSAPEASKTSGIADGHAIRILATHLLRTGAAAKSVAMR